MGLFDMNIYIDQYDNDYTRKYQNLLVSIINQITPCSFTEIEGKKLIKFKTFAAPEGTYNPVSKTVNYEKNMMTYRKNLILLNFIRNLWYEPGQDYTQKPPYPYTHSFFSTLENNSEILDPLQRLTHANQIASQKINSPYHSFGHSNASKFAIQKKTIQLFNSPMKDTHVFLTSEIA